MARNRKKVEAVVEEQVPVMEAPVEVTQIEQPEVIAEAPVEQPQEEIAQVTVNNDEKITGITKANYKANLARANELKSKLVAHLAETGGFPSHRFIQKTWGYNISLKAIIRHKNRITQAQGLTDKVKTTDSLPRPKKAPKAEVQEVAQVEQLQEATA